MHQEYIDSKQLAQRTQLAYVGTRVLDTPFWGIFNLLAFILYKDLHATPFQLAVLITLKPLVSLFASYWSAAVNKRRDRLKGNILLARLLGYLPFFFFPYIDSPWYYIAAFGNYMMMTMGIVPAWMELLKLNVPQVTREKVFSYSQAFGYLGGGLIPFILGGVLDEYAHSWRWLFPVAATIGLSSAFFQFGIMVNADSSPSQAEKQPVSHHLLKPWKNAWNLLKERPDFAKFQVGFMLLGSALMVMQPALPVYFVDVLNLSYTELAVSVTLCKGIGFVLASPLWSKWINRIDLFMYSSCLALLACVFPLCLMLSQTQIASLYIGYLIYGFMQSGSELGWNMSGPIFSKHSDSSPFTSVNVAAVGVRGCFVPLIGGLLLSSYQSSFVMQLGCVLCLLSALAFAFYSRQLSKNVAEQR